MANPMLAAPRTTLTVVHQDVEREGEQIIGMGKVNTEVFKADPAKLNTAMDSDTATAVVTWAKDTFVGITNDYYLYTKIEENISINEVVSNIEP